MAEGAVVKAHCKAELIALIHTQAQHFAVFELHTSKHGLLYFGIAEVAALEHTLKEPDVGDIGAGEVAVGKGAAFVLPHL